MSEENKKKKESPRDCSNSGSKLVIQKDDCGYLYIKNYEILRPYLNALQRMLLATI